MAKRNHVEVARRQVKNWDEADTALKDIAVIDLQIQKEEAEYNKAEQERRAKVTEKHAPLKEEKQKIEVGLENFVTAHRADLGDKKSKRLAHGTVSYRLHPPVVATIKGMTQKAAAAIISRSRKWKDKFLRITIGLNKSAIATAYSAGDIKAPELEKFGITVEQKESFGYDPDYAIVEAK